MKKVGRKTLAILAGLTLGWLCAGFVSDGTSSVLSQAHAAPAEGHDHDHAHGELDEGQKTAGQLLPTADQIPFFSPVVTAAAGLFGLALVFGVAYRSFGGKDPGVVAAEADQAAAHHDHHDAHSGHDGHGHH